MNQRNTPPSQTAKSVLPTRRKFLWHTAAVTAGGLPLWAIQQARAQDKANEKIAPTEKLGVGLIGCGGQGMGDASLAEKYGNIVAVCDVDAARVNDAKKKYPQATGFADFRKLLEQKNVDVIICGTVDHWHTIVSMAAMKAGKDVYCEKPLTLTIDEGKHLVKVQKETGRILQTGTQQRSEVRFRLACELIRNNRLGKLKKVDVWIPAGRREGPFKTSPVPESLNYDFWQGQTPAVDYVKERTHLTFRYWWEYSGGTITDWGAHHNDIVLWALDRDRSGPTQVEAKGLIDMIPGGFTATSEYEIDYTYDDGLVHSCKSTKASAWHGGTVDPKGQLHGIKFYGENGWLWVTRGTIDAQNRDVLQQKPGANEKHAYFSNNHMQNFFDCVKSRKETICPAEVGHRSATLCHLAAISLRMGKKVKWDPTTEQIVGDDEANKLQARAMRAGYGFDML